MNKLMISFVAALSLTTLGCGKKGAANEALSKMEGFSKSMCDCKDKACADKVNDDMAKWGQEMAKNAKPGDAEKPDPEMAKKSADVMTKYTECMTKLMMAGMGGDKPVGGDKPAGGDKPDPAAAAGKCPDGFSYNTDSNFCIKVPAGMKQLHDGKADIVGNNKAHEFSWVGGDKGSDSSIIVNVSNFNQENWDYVAKDVKSPTYQGKALEDGKIGDQGLWGIGEDGPPPTGFAQRRYIKSVNRNEKMELSCKVTRANGTGAPTEADVFEACKTIQFAK